MADASEKYTRIIAVAVDHSEWSEQAFECEYKSYFFAIHAAGMRIKSAANNYANKKFATVKAFSLMSLWALMLEFLVHFCGPKRRLS